MIEDDELIGVEDWQPTDGDYPPDASAAELVQQKKRLSVNRREATERRIEALELRETGYSWRQIAEECGYANSKVAQSSVQKYMASSPVDMRDDIRSLNYNRLNGFLVRLQPAISMGDTKAIETALKILEKIDKLFGTEAPEKLEVEINTNNVLVIQGTEAEYIASLKEMAGEPPPPKLMPELPTREISDLAEEHEVFEAESTEVVSRFV